MITWQHFRRASARTILGRKLASRIYGFRLAKRLRQGVAPGLDNSTLRSTMDLLRHGDVTLDIGALGGDWCYSMAERVGLTGRVFGIEADPFFAQVLHSAFNKLQLDNVEIIHTALGERNRAAKLKTKTDEGGELLGFAHIAQDDSETDGVCVTMITLDELVERYPELLKCKLLKIDTEGYEPMILKGGLSFLQKVKPILVSEVNNEWLRRFGWDASRFLSLLRDIGYMPIALNGQAKLPEAILESALKESNFSADITFVC